MTGIGRWPMCGPPAPPEAASADAEPGSPVTKRKREGRKKRRARPQPVTWASVSAAVALAVDARMPSGVTQAELIGDSTPEQVVWAQAIVMRAMLGVLAPEAGMRALRSVGLLALEEVSRGDR